jgi:hypothetical protein
MSYRMWKYIKHANKVQRGFRPLGLLHSEPVHGRLHTYTRRLYTYTYIMRAADHQLCCRCSVSQSIELVNQRSEDRLKIQKFFAETSFTPENPRNVFRWPMRNKCNGFTLFHAGGLNRAGWRCNFVKF